MWTFFKCGVVAVAGFAAMVPGTGSAGAQARSTSQRRLDFSAFGLFSGTYTGLGSAPVFTGSPEGPQGRNLTFSLGADLGVYTFHGARLGAEVRGGLPINSGQVDGQKSLLAGIRITHEPSGYGAFGRVRPYVDVLAGRGQITYKDELQSGGYPILNTVFLSSNSNVYAAGGGLEFDVTRAFSIKADAQFQRWNTPVTASGVLHVPQGGVGIVYRYGTGRGPR